MNKSAVKNVARFLVLFLSLALPLPISPAFALRQTGLEEQEINGRPVGPKAELLEVLGVSGRTAAGMEEGETVWTVDDVLDLGLWKWLIDDRLQQLLSLEKGDRRYSKLMEPIVLRSITLAGETPEDTLLIYTDTRNNYHKSDRQISFTVLEDKGRREAIAFLTQPGSFIGLYGSESASSPLVELKKMADSGYLTEGSPRKQATLLNALSKFQATTVNIPGYAESILLASRVASPQVPAVPESPADLQKQPTEKTAPEAGRVALVEEGETVWTVDDVLDLSKVKEVVDGRLRQLLSLEKGDRRYSRLMEPIILPRVDYLGRRPQDNVYLLGTSYESAALIQFSVLEKEGRREAIAFFKYRGGVGFADGSQFYSDPSPLVDLKEQIAREKSPGGQRDTLLNALSKLSTITADIPGYGEYPVVARHVASPQVPAVSESPTDLQKQPTEKTAPEAGRVALLEFVAKHQDVIELLTEGRLDAAKLEDYFPEAKLQELAQSAGYRQGVVLALPQAGLPSAFLERGIPVFVQEKWRGQVKAHLQQAVDQGAIRFVDSNPAEAYLVIGEENAIPLQSGQVFIGVNEQTVSRVTPGLLQELQQRGLLEPGSVVILYRAPKDSILIFA